MTYRSTKTYCHNTGLSCAFRQWRATSHCHFLHGYALEVRLEFEAVMLDANGWVVDFGSLKPLKAKLEAQFDHKTLVAADDPHLDWYQEAHQRGIIDMLTVEAMGVEAFAKLVFNMASKHIASQYPRVRVALVEVKEHAGNSAIYIP